MAREDHDDEDGDTRSVVRKALQKRGAVADLKTLMFTAVQDNQAKAFVRRHADILRVINTPKVDYDDTPDLTAELMYPGKPRVWTYRGQQITGLRPAQSAALAAIRDANGGIFPLPVGKGKSLVALLAGTVLQADAVILCPSRIISQLRSTYLEWGQHFRFPQNCVIESYDKISREPYMLQQLGEKSERLVIIADEVHRLANVASARTNRVMKFFEEDRPDAFFVGMSGTLTYKSLKQMVHIVALALRANAPVPLDGNTLVALSKIMDVSGEPGQDDWMRVMPLWEHAYPGIEMSQFNVQERITQVRSAFQRNFYATRGIYATAEPADVSSALIVVGEKVQVPETVQKLIDLACVPPDENGDLAVGVPGGPGGPQSLGNSLVRTLSAGFFLKWDWPNDIVDHEWRDARTEWARWLRKEKAENRAVGYDTDMLIFNAIARQVLDGCREPIHMALIQWMKHKHKKAPPTSAVWIDLFLVNYAMNFIVKHRGPERIIVWYKSPVLGDKLRDAGLLVYGAGSTVNTEQPVHCAMSYLAQSEGLDLQWGWSINLILEPPANGKYFEQLIGRTHRTGQPADEVYVHIVQHSQAFKDAVAHALGHARYIRETMGTQQKLELASYDWSQTGDPGIMNVDSDIGDADDFDGYSEDSSDASEEEDEQGDTPEKENSTGNNGTHTRNAGPPSSPIWASVGSLKR